MRQQVKRGLPAPLEVIEEQDDRRSRAGQSGQQRGERLVKARALLRRFQLPQRLLWAEELFELRHEIADNTTIWPKCILEPPAPDSHGRAILGQQMPGGAAESLA